MCGGVREVMMKIKGSLRFIKQFSSLFFFSIVILAPSLASAQKVKLTWTPREENNISQYKIYRSIDDNQHFVEIGSVDHPTSTYYDNDIEFDTHYFYVVTSVDESNNESEHSDLAEVITPKVYHLTVSVDPASGGTVSKSPQKSEYIDGEQVELSAEPSSGYRFDHWSGNASGTDPTITITMNSNKTVTAHFAPIEYSLSISINPSNAGVVSKSPDKSSYSYGEQVTLTADANSGYEFDHWGGDASGSNSTVTITMTRNKSVTAYFDEQQYTLTINIEPQEGGSVTRDPDKQFYLMGEEVRLKAVPGNEFQFDFWSGDVSSNHPNITIIINGNKNITANFKMKHRVAGYVVYRESAIPLNEAYVDLTGDTSATVSSNENGYYEFSSLEEGADYFTKAIKNSEITDDCILSYDAAIAARIALNLIPDVPYGQELAADVDRNNDVQMFDASLIAQFAVGLSHPQCHAGDWGFTPANRVYVSLDSNYYNQDFIGTVIGDVDGNWNPENNLPKARGSKKIYSYLEDMEAANGEELIIPFYADRENEILSFDIKLRFDENILSFKGINQTDLSKNFQIFINDKEKGELMLGGFGIEPIKESGKYLELVFEVVGDNDQPSQVELYSYRINAEDEQYAIATVVVSSDGHSSRLPKDYVLYNNFPNPFNPETSIKFQLPQQDHVVIKIFNMMGQEIRTLVDEDKAPGTYQIKWDGKNDWGNFAPSGNYVYRMQTKKFKDARRMIFLK